MKTLEGLTILLVEDEFLIALDAEEMLQELGAAHIEVVGSYDQAESRVREGNFDLAILDVNLDGKLSFPLAKILLERGIPVLFGTGYNLISKPMAGFENGVCVTKPYSAAQLEKGLSTALQT